MLKQRWSNVEMLAGATNDTKEKLLKTLKKKNSYMSESL